MIYVAFRTLPVYTTLPFLTVGLPFLHSSDLLPCRFTPLLRYIPPCRILPRLHVRYTLLTLHTTPSRLPRCRLFYRFAVLTVTFPRTARRIPTHVLQYVVAHFWFTFVVAGLILRIFLRLRAFACRFGCGPVRLHTLLPLPATRHRVTTFTFPLLFYSTSLVVPFYYSPVLAVTYLRTHLRTLPLYRCYYIPHPHQLLPPTFTTYGLPVPCRVIHSVRDVQVPRFALFLPDPATRFVTGLLRHSSSRLF